MKRKRNEVAVAYIFLEGLKKTMKVPSHDTCLPGHMNSRMTRWGRATFNQDVQLYV
jgi:hypothetical protein